jgi:serine/threonine protein kinase
MLVQVLRGEPYSEKCDIWSFGVVLWELIHRKRPYADCDVPIFLLMMNLGNGSLQLPPVSEKESTPGLSHLVDRCLAPAAAERPSFREILQLLQNEYKSIRGKPAGKGVMNLPVYLLTSCTCLVVLRLFLNHSTSCAVVALKMLWCSCLRRTYAINV